MADPLTLEATHRWQILIAKVGGTGGRRYKTRLEAGELPPLEEYFELLLTEAANGSQAAQEELSARSFEILLMLLTDPFFLDAERAQQWALQANSWIPALDSKLLGQVSRDQAVSPTKDEELQINRILSLVECFEIGVRTLPQMAKFIDSKRKSIRSKASKLATPAMQNPDWLQKLLLDADPRVRANALDGIRGQTNTDLERIRTALEAATRDPHHRVATTALLILALKGSTEAEAKLRKMAEGNSEIVRKAAEWALGQLPPPAADAEPPASQPAAGEPAPSETTASGAATQESAAHEPIAEPVAAGPK